MPNITNFKKLRDAIANDTITTEGGGRVTFDMGDWGFNKDYGTPACIGGSAELLQAKEQGVNYSATNARIWLGLTHDEKGVLFFPAGDVVEYYEDISKQDALKALDRIIGGERITRDIWDHVEGFKREK